MQNLDDTLDGINFYGKGNAIINLIKIINVN